MDIKLIKTEEDYKIAVKYLEELGDNPDFGVNPKLKNESELIEKLILDYDNEHYSIEKGDPIEIIKLKMSYMNLRQKDLITSIGSKGLVSEVLNRKRKLSKKMIRDLSKLLNISQEILNTEYELASTICKEVTKERTESGTLPFRFSKAVWLNIEDFSNKVLERRAIINVSSMMINL
jgi:HTH-type transcriptional regulator / antitoxin HigA